MTQPISKEAKIKLEIGMWLDFMVISKVILQDGKEYLILEDPNGLRHFLEAGLFAGYPLTVGKKINCKVDHINCTGRIFLEPQHPHYIIGKRYFFPIRSLIEEEGCILAILDDCFKNAIEMEFLKEDFRYLEKENGLICIVRGIKKGIPELDYSINYL